MKPSILVTGANAGIGLALSKQLCKDYGAHVFLGSRSLERGELAIEQVQKHDSEGKGSVELVLLDVASDESVQAAAQKLQSQNVKLNAIVNNAGTGLGHGATNEQIMNVNFMGVKRVVDAFVDLLDTEHGARIVNVGSGSGPLYIAAQPLERKKKLCNPDITWEELLQEYNRGVPPEDPAHGGMGTDHYGLSKALLAGYTRMLAKQLSNRNISVYCLTPGYIDTNMTKAWGGGKKPEEGTVSLRHCLFEADPSESGWFFGSDAKRSPPHFLRNPGEPVFDGTINW